MRNIIAMISFAFLVLAVSNPAHANNLNISNATVASQDGDDDTATIQFDVSWDNSWRDNDNFDAVWVFIKYSTDLNIYGNSDNARAAWGHAILKTSGTNPSGFSRGTGTGLDIVVSNDKRGFFLQRSQVASSAGSVSTSSIQVLWDYAANGLTDAQVNNLSTAVKIFGIEMVYIPEEGFYIGDESGGANGEFEFGGSGGSKPCPVISEETLLFTAETSNCYYNTDAGSADMGDGAVFQVSQSFPKGYQAFYAMKYEITQGQYAEFLNTLSRAQQTTRMAVGSLTADSIANFYVMSGQSLLANSYRNTITAPSVGNASLRPIALNAAVPYRAMNYLSWMDLAAFADWAALRPMTELEFEKIARGPVYPIIYEYAWGSTVITAGAAFSGSEDGTERITTAGANANYNATVFSSNSSGPYRVGISSSTNVSANPRLYSGAGYYGNMELTGNVWERAVTIGNSLGRGFAGTHGDGALTSVASYEGNATNVDWPGLDGTNQVRGITGSASVFGSGFRGGSWSTTALSVLGISNRRDAAKNDGARANDYGGRLVRAASA